jgi:hypothetical protein
MPSPEGGHTAAPAGPGLGIRGGRGGRQAFGGGCRVMELADAPRRSAGIGDSGHLLREFGRPDFEDT